MFASLGKALRQGRAVLSRLDPVIVRAEDAARLLDAFVELERLAGAGRTMLAARAAESGAWKRQGHRTAAAWRSAKTDLLAGSAAVAIETAARLEQLPATQDALRRGLLTDARATEIASAAGDAPESESSLLALARKGSLRELRDECRRVRAVSGPDEASHYESIRTTQVFPLMVRTRRSRPGGCPPHA